MGKHYTFLKKQDTLISPIFINVRKYTNFFTLHFVIFYNILKLKILSFIFFFRILRTHLNYIQLYNLLSNFSRKFLVNCMVYQWKRAWKKKKKRNYTLHLIEINENWKLKIKIFKKNNYVIRMKIGHIFLYDISILIIKPIFK